MAHPFISRIVPANGLRFSFADLHRDFPPLATALHARRGIEAERYFSCGAKRAAQTAARLREEIFEPVGHAQWVFTVPKMLQPYFLRSDCLAALMTIGATEAMYLMMCRMFDELGYRRSECASMAAAKRLGASRAYRTD